MTRAISQDDFIATASNVLSAVGSDSFVIEREGKFIAALVSEAEFELIRQARGRRAIAAMNRISDAVEAVPMTADEIVDLEKAFDRKA